MSDNIICSGCGAYDYIKPKHLLSFTQEEIKCWKCSSCERKNYLKSLKKSYLNQESIMTESSHFKKQIQELTEEISNHHKKIIDDWSKAYLSQLYEEGKEIKPGCFTLIEQEPSVYDGVFCRRYWFEQGIPNYSEEKKLEWQPIETAPKGGGAKYVTDPNWIDPPTLLLYTPEGIVIGSWDYYYDKDGSGYIGTSAWSYRGEIIACEFGEPTHWMPIPKLPKK